MTIRYLPIAVAATISTAFAQQRLNLPVGGSNWVAPAVEGPGLITTDLSSLTPDDLVLELLGPGVNFSGAMFTGVAVAGGTFSGGTGIVGFERGVVLSSGNVATIAGPSNTLPDATTVNGTPGDPDLDALVGGGTEDAAALEFLFECANATDVSFQFVFMSEEYNDFVNSQFNDAFALLLNGVNIALIPGTTSPVSINNVNCGNPFDPAGGTNCALFQNNDCDSLGLGFPCTNIATEMDGFTTVFSATGPLVAGQNSLKLVVADVFDSLYDSNVLIRGQSIVCATPAPAFDPPTPCGQQLMVAAGTPIDFTAVAIATTGLPGQTVSIDATGSPAALSGGVFNPALPTAPEATSTTAFSWTPSAMDIGLHVITLTATDQLGGTTSCDVELLVVPAGVVSQPICDPNVANSTGLPARLWAVGSDVAANNSLDLLVANTPAAAFALAVNSRELSVVANPGGSMGNLCIASNSMGRHNNIALTSDPSGMGQFAIDLTAMPFEPGGQTSVATGETWYWQVWYRDTLGGTVTGNWSNAVAVTFQ